MKFAIKSLALKWFYFFCPGCVVLISEFSHLFMKQLGLTPQQIGFTTLMGVPHLFMPLCLALADKFRARRLVAIVGSGATVVSCFLPLLPLVLPLMPSCFTWPYLISKNSSDLTVPDYKTTAASYTGRVPWLSAMFFLLVLARTLSVTSFTVVVPLGDLAVITYLKEQRASYGAYFMWCHFGAGFSIFSVGVLAWCIRIITCEAEDYGYFTVYIVASCMSLLSMISLAWFKFEYNEKEKIHWSQLISTLFNVHYILMFLVLFYIGLCVSFQSYWEFWYLDGLSASPILMGSAGLVRRPLLALSMLLSGHLLGAIGDLKTVCVALFFYILSFLALSFTRIPWVVLAIDVFQAAAYGLAYCTLTIHFSKVGSKANSGVILGLKETCFSMGLDIGATLLGVLFNAWGTQKTLLLYSISSGVVLVILLLYILFSNRVEYYERVSLNSDEE